MTDNRGVGAWNSLVRWGAATAVALGIVFWSTPAVPASYTLGPSCGQKPVASPTGVGILILFANNGSVQRYQVTAHADNPEDVNNTLSSLEAIYGPAGVYAPALRIVSYKAGDSGGMQLPNKAIDSCGRTLDFN
jgi:hypothetical protein